MILWLEVEYLSGVCFAAIGPDSQAPDWPPQPDRIFSALVATWAARGQARQEADALEWLEKLPIPRILASAAQPRTAPAVYVPPNDYTTPNGELNRLKWYRDYLGKKTSPPEKGGHKKLWMQAWNVMPDQRKRSGLKERSFPASRPHDPVVRFFWEEAAPNETTLTMLQKLAADTAYVGHSASLTRCHFWVDQEKPDLHTSRLPKRRIYAGRFIELCRAFNSGRRPLAGANVPPVVEPVLERTNLFGRRWMILEHVAGDMPDLRACSLVAKSIRNTLLSGYRKNCRDKSIPEVVSGHTPDGSPTREHHLAIVPLPFVGFPYADGHVMGFALVPPHDNPILEDEDFRAALRLLSPLDEELERRVLTISTKSGMPRDRAFAVKLAPTFETPMNKRSINPALYTVPARTFATLSPIVLDRHLKKKGEARQAEIAAQIAGACRNIGLPEPEAVVADKHSAVEGAPSIEISGKSPAWMRWRLPASLASRQLTHAVIRFSEPVEGPVVLGAGRFMGLGLCRPLDGDKH